MCWQKCQSREAGDQYQPPSSSASILYGFRTPHVSTAPAWVARKETPALVHPQTKSRPACQRGTGQDSAARGETNALSTNRCRHGLLGGHTTVPSGQGVNSRGYHPWVTYGVFISTGIYQLYFYFPTYCISCAMMYTSLHQRKESHGRPQERPDHFCQAGAQAV
jgi:hypothetical protein